MLRGLDAPRPRHLLLMGGPQDLGKLIGQRPECRLQRRPIRVLEHLRQQWLQSVSTKVKLKHRVRKPLPVEVAGQDAPAAGRKLARLE